MEIINQPPSLNEYIKKLDKLSFKGVPLTDLHKLRGTLSGEVNDKEGESYDLAQAEGGTWDNVAEHGAMSMLVTDVLGEAFRLSNSERGKLNIAVWLQDSGKKTERMWQRAIESAEKEGSSQLVEEENPSQKDSSLRQQAMLRNVADMEEWENAEAGFASPRISTLMKANVPQTEAGHGDDLAAKISWFSDAILNGANIVGIQRRFDELESDPRNGERNIAFSDSYRPKYNGKSLYEVQRALGAGYESEFAERLGIAKEQLYPWLKSKVEDRISSQRMPLLPEKA